MSEKSGVRPKLVEFTGCRPVLPVKDVEVSIAHYGDVLGFTEDWRWSDGEAGAERSNAPTFAYVYRGHFQLFLAQRPAPIQSVEIVVGVQTVEDVDRLYQEYQSSGAMIEERPDARPWGTYEMRIRDPDLHLMRMLTSLPSEM
jgi:uncharacterized glyoxalase superfamily protein PhnB